MRRVAIVAPHFPPSNLAGVHRARLLAQHLNEFGWQPVIVTTHWRHYEEMVDWELASLVDPSLEVIRTKAFPTRPLRIVGDIGVRALPWHLAVLRKLRRENRFDFLHITVPSFYSAILGQLLFREAPLPFGIDYQDPWVHAWPGAELKCSKAWASMKLAERLEPWAVRNVALLTGVAEGYYKGVLKRNPQVADRCVTAAMPVGFSTRDFEAPVLAKKKPYLFDSAAANINVIYAGALLPKAVRVLECFLGGLALFRERGGPHTSQLCIHFIGTGKSPNDPNGHNVIHFAERMGVSDLVREHPNRLAYLDVLVHLTRAYGVLIIASTEPHYTPSKIYQAVQSRRPILAFLHEASTAVGVLAKSGAGMAVTLSEERLPSAEVVADALSRFISGYDYDAGRVDWSAFEAFSARESARRMALAMDEAARRFEAKFPRCRPRAPSNNSANVLTQ
jgi:hypothetical protein